jgi:hypothetical protein
MKRVGLLLTILCTIAPSGCRKAAPPATDSEARGVVTRYFGALTKQDWDAAYSLLHSESKSEMDRDAFSIRATAYCKHLGFTLGKAVIRSCDEQGEQAIAQVTLQDAAGSAKRYREGLILKKDAGRWRIVLPANFGRD